MPKSYDLTPAQNKLVSDNYRLVDTYVRRFGSRFIDGPDELRSIAHLTIMRCAANWRPDHGTSFSSYVFRSMSLAAFDVVRNRRERTRSSEDGLEDHYNSAIAPNPTTSPEAKEFWEMAKSSLPPRTWEVLSDRMNGLRLAEIGKKLGVSKERARQIESDAFKRLLENFTMKAA